MTMPTFVPGYLGTVTLNSEDLSAIGHVTRLNKTRRGLPKKVFGQRYQYAIGGQREFVFSANGSITAEQAAALDAAYETDAAVGFSLQIGEGAGATDAGLYTGSCVLTELTIESNADGQHTWAVSAIGTGTPVYTPAGS
jgi:hypothetical protein